MLRELDDEAAFTEKRARLVRMRASLATSKSVALLERVALHSAILFVSLKLKSANAKSERKSELCASEKR